MKLDKQLLFLFTGSTTALVAIGFALYGSYQLKPNIVGIADFLIFSALIQLVIASYIDE